MAPVLAVPPTRLEAALPVVGRHRRGAVVADPCGCLLTVTRLRLNIVSQNGGRDLTVMSSVAGFDPGRQLRVLTGGGRLEVAIQGHSNLPMPVEFRVYFHSSSGVTLNGAESVGMGSGTAIDGT